MIRNTAIENTSPTRKTGRRSLSFSLLNLSNALLFRDVFLTSIRSLVDSILMWHNPLWVNYEYQNYLRLFFFISSFTTHNASASCRFCTPVDTSLEASQE